MSARNNPRRVMVYIVMVFATIVLCLVIGIISAMVKPAAPIPIACNGHPVVAYADGGNGGEAMVAQIATELGIDPNEITNIHDANIQAHTGTLNQGQPFVVCFEEGGKRVAQINGVEMTE